MIVTTAGVFVTTGTTRFLYQTLVHHLLEIVIEGTGPNLVLTLRLLNDLPHDGVPVPILSG